MTRPTYTPEPYDEAVDCPRCGQPFRIRVAAGLMAGDVLRFWRSEIRACPACHRARMLREQEQKGPGHELPAD